MGVNLLGSLAMNSLFPVPCHASFSCCFASLPISSRLHTEPPLCPALDKAFCLDEVPVLALRAGCHTLRTMLCTVGPSSIPFSNRGPGCVCVIWDRAGNARTYGTRRSPCTG